MKEGRGLLRDVIGTDRLVQESKTQIIYTNRPRMCCCGFFVLVIVMAALRRFGS